jgi:dTMP kinase
MAFLVVEGIDGAGKSRLVEGLRAALQAEGADPAVVREPGSTAVGERVRALLLDPKTGPLGAWTEACLFVACRAELVIRSIRPALARGSIVLADRYLHSTLAYQGGGGGADRELLRALNLAAVGGLLPDLVLLLDLAPREARARRGPPWDRMEVKGLEHLDRVRQAYLEEARLDPGRFEILDAAASPETCLAAARRALEARGLWPSRG